MTYQFTFQHRRYNWGSWTTDTVNFDPCNGEAQVIILPRPVTVTAGSDSKLYDGLPLTNGDYTISETTDVTGFVAGEGFETVVMTAGSTITLPGTVANVIDEDTATLKSNTNPINYDITYLPGTLEVVRNSLQAEGTPIIKIYDGKAADPVPVVVRDGYGNILPEDKYTITYAAVPWAEEWTAEQPAVTNTIHQTPVFFIVDGGPGYGVVTNYSHVTVLPREVVVKADDASKEYDGTPLTEDGFTIMTEYDPNSNAGFVPGEGIDFATMTEESTITEPGQETNTIESITLQENTLAQNYTITYLTGELTVTPVVRELVIIADSGTRVYDGTEYTEPGFTYSEDVLAEGDVLVVEVTGGLVDVGETDNVITSYKVMRGDKDVTAYYMNITTIDGELEVTPRPVVITADSATKVYDGTPLTEGGYTVEGFVEGEGVSSVTMTSDSSITEPGSTPNVIGSHELAPGTKARNYTVTYVDGTLEVTPRSGIHVIAASDEKVYDGTALTNGNYTVETTVLLPGDEVVAVVVGSVTNVGEVVNEIVDVRVMHGNEDVTHHYTNVTKEDGTLEVMPRPVVIRADSAEKVYDGTPLTEGGYTVEGFVEGEGVESVTMTPESSITFPGTTDNEIAYYVLSEGTDPNNYDITTEDGTLTVTPITAEIGVKANSAEKVYDGTPLTDDGYTVVGTENLVPGDTVVAVVVGTITDTGTTENVITEVRIMRGDEDVTAYYTNVTKEDGSLDVMPRPVVIKADSAEKDYDGEPLTEDGFTSEGFVPGEGVSVATMTPESTITDPGTVANVIESVILIDGTNPDNYTFTYEEGTLTVYSPRDPLIAEFTLAVENDALNTMRVYVLGMREGDVLYFAGAETFADACAEQWTYIVDSEVPYEGLDIGSDNISVCRDIELDNSEYRYFRPYILTPNGTVYPGRKFVGVTDVPMDRYGETSAGVHFVECLSEAGDLPGVGVVEPDISPRYLVQTNTLISGSVLKSDKLYLLRDDENFDVYTLGADREWAGVQNEKGTKPSIEDVFLPRGVGLVVVRMAQGAQDVEGIVRLHGQVSVQPLSMEVPDCGIIQVASTIPGPLNLNDKAYGLVGEDGDMIVYMDEYDTQWDMFYGNPDGAGMRWYTETTKIVKGKRTVVPTEPMGIPSGRVFWYSTEARIFPGAVDRH